MTRIILFICLLFNINFVKACSSGTSRKPTVLLPFNNTECGADPISIGRTLNKIINGQTASNIWPWIVSIRIKSGNSYAHVCGGSIVSSQYILTAAHCLTKSMENYRIYYGSSTLSGTVNFVEVYKSTIHRLYKIVDGNDIAILTLMAPITYTSSVYSICIPPSSDSELVTNKEAIAIGWGSVNGQNSQQSLSNTLQQVTLEIKNPTFSSCDNIAANYCALEKTANPDSNICYGDSGGPLMYKKSDNKWYIFGISSFIMATQGNLCNPSLPSFYTKVPNTINTVLSDL